MVEARRYTVRHLASSTADAEVVVTTVGELIDLVLPVGIRRTELTSFSRSDALDEGAVFIGREQTYTASSLREGVLDRDRDLRLLTYLTTLGGNHDNPVGSARTVDSGSGSILEDVHRSDVLRVERAEDTGSTSDSGVLDGHTVDDDQRVVAGIERSTTTDTDTAGSTGRSFGSDLHPCDLTDEEIAGSGDSTLLEALFIEGADRSGEVLLLHRAVADDDDFLEVLCAFFKDDLQRLRSTAEGNSLRGVPDAGDHEVTSLGSTQGKVTVDVGDDALGCLLDTDGSTDDGFTLVVYYLPLDLDFLCPRWSCQEEQSETEVGKA